MAKFVYNPYPTTHNRNPFAGMSIKTDKGWQKAEYFINNLNPKIKRSFEKASLEIGKLYLKNIREIIQTQGKNIGWAPLSAKYKKKKLQHTNNDMYRYYDVLYKGFQLIQQKDKVQIGIRKGLLGDKRIKRGNEGMTVGQYLYVLEHGSFWYDIKPRPLLGPAWKQIGGKSGVATTLHKHMKQQIRVS